MQSQCLIAQSPVSQLNLERPKTSSKGSNQSSNLSLNAKLAAAEVAATQEVIKIMDAQHQQEQEIQRLEVEYEMLEAEREAQEKEVEADNARKRAQLISESAARRIKLEGKRKEVERLEELKKHNAAQARLQVYAEGEHGNQEKTPVSSLSSTETRSLPLPT